MEAKFGDEELKFNFNKISDEDLEAIFGADYLKFNRDDLAGVIREQQARIKLTPLMINLQKQIAEQKKAHAILAAAEALKAIRGYVKLCATEDFDKVTGILTAVIKALSATDESQRRQAMIEVERWHGEKNPLVIWDLPRFRNLVFNVTLWTKKHRAPWAYGILFIKVVDNLLLTMYRQCNTI